MIHPAGKLDIAKEITSIRTDTEDDHDYNTMIEYGIALMNVTSCILYPKWRIVRFTFVWLFELHNCFDIYRNLSNCFLLILLFWWKKLYWELFT